MNKRLKYYSLFYVVFAVLMMASPLMADVNSVTTSPTNTNVLFGQSVSVSVVWTIDESTAPVTVISTSGEFRPAIGSPVLLGTVPTTLSSPVPTPGIITFSETVLVPNSVIFQARIMGNTSFVYQRTFTDGIVPGTGGIILNITRSGGINSVTTSPTNRNVPLGRSVSVSVVWTIDEGSAPVTVTSTSGEFRPAIGSPVLFGTVPTTLSRRVVSPGLITFSETVLVPESVIYHARKIGYSSFVYQRTFTDVITSGTGGIRLDITGSAGAGFSINRISLRFDDDSPVRLIPHKEKFRAFADITFSGSGLIKAVWEIADPSSTSGEPVYRTLRIVRKQLNNSRRVALPSPELPTDRIGIHLVRLRITDPETAFSTPNIRYFVSDKKPDTPEPPAPVGLLTPKPGAKLTPETSFGWQAMAGARAYQLELYAKQEAPILGQPVTGMLVPAEQLQTPLSKLAWQHIGSGEVYLWRVMAIAENGNVIGESQLREISAP